MTPDYYLSQMKIYSRFVRNFNPAQQDKQQMLKIAVGPGGGEPRWTEWTETDHEGLPATHVELGHQWPFDAFVHGRAMATLVCVRRTLARPSTARSLSLTLEMDDLINKHSAIMDKYDPEKKVALVVDEWGAWYAPLPGSNPGFLVQQNSLRDAILAASEPEHFCPPRRPGARWPTSRK